MVEGGRAERISGHGGIGWKRQAGAELKSEIM